ncbi:MAG: alpha/beta hydrolase [Streptosporangiaceae bacterium]|nr:alpha/beta hydrolase [Streptosporangiaceae bacterium]MBV9858228.1 alpha/beta hydrolase [Streptosporangiaceae bacterium]
MSFSWASRRARLSLIFAAALSAAVAMAALLTATSQAATSRAATSQGAAFRWKGGARPVIVLEHGAWADASSWDRVIAILQREGFTVYAPPNPLRGLAYDAAYLHDFLTENAALAGKPVVLAGHSYGGAVISGAAVGDGEVKALVYVDAFIPAPGESIQTLLAAHTGSCIGGRPGDVFSTVPYPGGPSGDVDLYLLPGKFPGCFASGLSAGKAAELAATQRPLAASAAGEPSGPVAWTTVPSWAVVGTADQVIPRAELLFMARRAGAHITDVNAGHLSLISAAHTVAHVILQAARGTS